jgi:two-component system, LytTR family, response regulator
MIIPYKTLIIDDEPLARDRLNRILAGYKNHFDIIGEAVNGSDAFEKIESLKPDLIFLDIQMPGKNVFEMLSEIRHHPIVIFCTAYDNYALQAFESFSIDYLLKPVEKERIEATISKLEHLHKNQQLSDLIIHLTNSVKKNYPIAIPHKSGDKIILVKLSDITYFEADNKYVNFYNTESKVFLTEQKLQGLETKLPPEFLRVSKSIIVNCNYIKELHKYFRGKYILIINDIHRTKIETGASYRNQIKNKFNL